MIADNLISENVMSYIAREKCGCIVAAVSATSQRKKQELREWLDDDLIIERVTNDYVRYVGLAYCQEHSNEKE